MQKNSGSAVPARKLGCGRGFHTRPISLKKYIKSHSVRDLEPDWLFRFTIVFQLNNDKHIWSSLKMQWQLPHLTNDCSVWPWSAKQWAASWQNQQNGIYAQRRLRSAWASAHERTTKTLIRLGGCPGWSESSLGTRVILLVLSWGGSNMDVTDHTGQRHIKILP